MIYAGIVTFQPDISRLKENIEAIRDQVDRIVVVDNGSANVAEVAALVKEVNGIFITLGENKGIAFALNSIMKKAKQDGVTDVLLLDQDSVAYPNMVERLKPYRMDSVGIVAPFIVDRNKTADAVKYDSSVIEARSAARKGVITSGSLTNVKAWEFIGGFDDEMFIDYVDYDFNERLLIEGYKILRVDSAHLLHECGKANPTFLFTPRKQPDGKWVVERFYSFGHSPFRCYYKSRNRVIYTRKYSKYLGFKFEGIYQIPIQIILTMMFESNRRQKLSAFIKGIKDGFSMKVVPYEARKALHD